MKLFISKLHYDKNPNIFKKILIGILSFFSIPYKIITSIRNFLYDKKLIKEYLPKDVITISVGNLTTGGVGKTPFTAELANSYIAKCRKVAVLSRGYGGELSNKEVNIISDGKQINYSAKEAGDEPYWIATNCPSVVVLTCSSRVKAAKLAIQKFGCDVLIADDAFQHRKLGRNINLVLVDHANKFGNEHLLPAGPLRESFLGLKRATSIIVTDKTGDDESALKYCDEIKQRFNKPVFLCKMMPANAYNIKSNELLYQGATVLAFCAIGQPKEFFEFVKKDFYMQSAIEFPDHYSYNDSDIDLLLKTAAENNINFIVTTEKDAVKVKDIYCKYKTSVKIYALKLKACADIEDIVNAR